MRIDELVEKYLSEDAATEKYQNRVKQLEKVMKSAKTDIQKLNLRYEIDLLKKQIEIARKKEKRTK
jgi:phosphopantetheine adenylyltransferase